MPRHHFILFALAGAIGAAAACSDAAAPLLDLSPGTPISTVPPAPPAPPAPPLPPPLITILPDGEFGDTVQIAPGQSLELAAFYQDTGGLNVRRSGVTWSSSDVGIVTVSDSGVATAVTPGVARITANLLPASGTRTIRVAPTSGTATIRMISVSDFPVTMLPGVGVPATLAYGALSEQVIPAGTLHLSFDGVPPMTRFYFNPAFYELQNFLGFLPAGAHETFVAVSSESGPIIAWLPERTEAVPASSAPVRVMFAAQTTYFDALNVFITKPGERASVVTLQGCYLDWPFGYTAYTDRDPGDFDIVLLINKWGPNPLAPEAARFHVTATAGHATTFIISGSSPTWLKILSVVDR